jgi:hypothetical protein
MKLFRTVFFLALLAVMYPAIKARAEDSTVDVSTNLQTRFYRLELDDLRIGLKALQKHESTNLTWALREHLATLGLDFDPPKAIYLNERHGTLFVHATQPSLGTVEKFLASVKCPPVLVELRAKFVEVPIAQVSELLGPVSLASNGGMFTVVLAPRQTNQVFNSLAMTRDVEILTPLAVTTLSGRQTQIQAGRFKSALAGLSDDAATKIVQRMARARPDPLGPVLDVVPHVGADGYSINLVAVPTITELTDFDDLEAWARKYAAEIGAGSYPWPRFRIWQGTTANLVQDGETLLLGCFTRESGARQGKEAGSPESETKKDLRRVLVFVTPTIVDATGNRVHSEHDMRGFTPKSPPAKLQLDRQLARLQFLMTFKGLLLAKMDPGLFGATQIIERV